jgi:hypothetical protein
MRSPNFFDSHIASGMMASPNLGLCPDYGLIGSYLFTFSDRLHDIVQKSFSGKCGVLKRGSYSDLLEAVSGGPQFDSRFVTRIRMLSTA